MGKFEGYLFCTDLDVLKGGDFMKLISKIVLFTWIVSFLFFFSACTADEYPNREDVCDSNGEYLYTNLNEDYFKFDTYNTLEIIVSENERFILYDVTADENERGYGEWIKDGISVAIYFDNDGNTIYDRHGDLIISAFDNPYFPSQRIGYIARISNDTKNTTLRRWASGKYPYNVRFSDERIPVEAKTHTKEQPFDTVYLPPNALEFYKIDQETETKYICDEINLEFSGSTGEGTCVINQEAVSVIASFDMEAFAFSLSYNTADDRKGVVILVCQGQEISENEANYFVQSKSEYSNISVETVTIRKATIPGRTPSKND